MMAGNDIVSDMMQRLVGRLGVEAFPPAVMRSVEAEIRQDWAGNQVYITASPKRVRDAAMMDDYRGGVGIAQLSVRYAVSERRVRQILEGLYG